MERLTLKVEPELLDFWIDWFLLAGVDSHFICKI
jgi:hypothetical protein